MKLFVIAFFAVFLASYSDAQFGIDYENDTFLMDGKPFRYISGSLHYFRTPREHWRDRLRKLAAAGLNAVSTYVEWSLHEPEHGYYDFSLDLDIVEFINTAKEEGLFVILRIGPYICAERDMGGFPYWLLHETPDIQLRVNDSRYLQYIDTWLEVLFRFVEPLLYGNGGPIITVQVENEYGFYGVCDHEYTQRLAEIFQRYVSDKAVLFTTDGSDYGSLSCGKIDGVYATVDFGPGANVTQMVLNMKAVEPKGPFVNSEFYPGWLTHWGERWATRDTNDILKTLKEILDVGGNVNFYMFYGGTNFGFTAGANGGDSYMSDVTSYDYDAPISEAGDLTPKYMAIRDLILSYLNTTTVLPEPSPKGDYGVLNLKAVARMTSHTARQILAYNQQSSPTPLSFESIHQDKGYVLYETTLKKSYPEAELTADVRDRAHVYINSQLIGLLSREAKTTSLNVTLNENDVLSILVENLGRINNGLENFDKKGIFSDVRLGSEILSDWIVSGYDFYQLVSLVGICTSNPVGCNDGNIRIYTGTFIANVSSNIEYKGEQIPADSFLDVSNLGKGVVFVNNRNLGRYWSTKGPQYSLYVPGAFLKLNEPNDVILIEEEEFPDSLMVPFVTEPIIGDPK